MPRRRLIALDSYANETYGRSISSAIIAGTCVRCGKSVHPFTMRDAAARYPRSGLCERCQRCDEPIRNTIVPFNQNDRTDVI